MDCDAFHKKALALVAALLFGIVNGDISQIDLPRNVKSGLIDAQEKLKNIHQIDFVHFSAKDVVRHPVVAQIIRAYEPRPVKAEENQEETE